MTTDLINCLSETNNFREIRCGGSDRGLEASPFTAGTSIESGGEQPPSLCLSLSLPDRPLWPTDESNRHVQSVRETRGEPDSPQRRKKDRSKTRRPGLQNYHGVKRFSNVKDRKKKRKRRKRNKKKFEGERKTGGGEHRSSGRFSMK